MAHISSGGDGGSGACSNKVVLFPFMAQGHLNPFLDLARLLATRAPSLLITIVSTPGNVINLRPHFSSYPTVNFAELRFQIHASDLPENAENTDILNTPVAISRFYRVAESLLQAPFHRLISQIIESDSGRPPICIISDMFLGFTVDVAHAFGSRHVPLYTSGPYAMSIYNSIWTHFPHKRNVSNDDDHGGIKLPGLPEHVTIERSQLSGNMERADPGDPSSMFAKRQAEMCGRSDGSVWNTVEALEKWSLEMWERKAGTPVWAVGPLLPAARAGECERTGKVAGESPEKCVEWLEVQAPRSVVYVSFGSQNSVPVGQMMELANGLELCGHPFIWVLRNPTGIAVEEDFRPQWLPEGFEARIKETQKGLLVRNWAPQIEILSHRSTGAFLSHCGWNSVLESLSRGVPLIGWPLGSEQFYNAKLLVEEHGVCLEVARGINERIDGGDLARKIKMVMEGERAEEMRRRAESLSEEMRRAVEDVDGSSVRALDGFVETLMTWRKEMRTSGLC